MRTCIVSTAVAVPFSHTRQRLLLLFITVDRRIVHCVESLSSRFSISVYLSCLNQIEIANGDELNYDIDILNIDIHI